MSGLNKSENASQAAADEQAALTAATTSLDPPFPFDAIAFDPLYFGIPFDPAPQKE